MSNDDMAVEAVATQIREYLAKHPRSKDSLEGVQSWWLADSSRPITAGKVEQALELLAARGLITKDTLPDGRIIYAARNGGSKRT